MAIKITGVRSINTKLRRLEYEFKADAARILRDCPEDHARVADGLQVIARKMGDLARTLER